MMTPKLWSTLKHYDRGLFASDLLAGAVVGVLAIPLALAFAIASGVPPERGLYTAVVAGFLISVLGGSRVQIGGPTGAFVVIVYGIVSQHGMDGLALCTLMAGAILIVMGLSGMGSAIKFIPYPVTTGFTSGIAVIIFSSQMKDLLGLSMGQVPTEFLEKWRAYFETASTASPAAVGLSAATLLLLALWPKVTKRVPGPIVALLACTGAAHALGLPVETIGSRFGAFPRGLPMPSFPAIDWGQVPALVRPATTVALLAAIESLLSAVVADGMMGGRHRSNMELVAQGVANLATPLFGGIPATGAIARTATNIKSGGRTPVAGIVHALVLLLALLALGPFVSRVPLCVLAAVLVVVSYHMSEWRSFKSLLSAPRSDVAVLVTTFLLTVLVDLTVAVEVGMVLAAFLFMRRMAGVTEVAEISRELVDRAEEPDRPEIPPGIQVFDIRGPFFFGAADKLGAVLGQIQKSPKIFILQMKDVPVIDATGLKALQDFHKRCRRQGTAVMLAGVRPQPLSVLEKSGARASFDEVSTHASLAEALKRAKRLAS